MNEIRGEGTITIFYRENKKKKKRSYEIGFSNYKVLESIIKSTIEDNNNVISLKLNINLD